MPHQELSRQWKETISARPDARDIVKTMHLSSFPQGQVKRPAEGIHLIQLRMEDIVLLEIKGRLPHLHPIALPSENRKTLWLCMQFHGKLVFPNGSNSYPDNLLSLITEPEDYTLTLAADRQWVLFFGLSGNSKLQLLAELPALRRAYDEQEHNTLRSVSISYLERRILEVLCKKAMGPFNALYQTGVAMGKLFGNYTLQLVKPQVLSREEYQVQIYHGALAYIQEHYLDEDLTSEKIGDVLGCSARNLTRAFEGRSLGVKATILTVRLYKARELLQTQPDLSVERIAGMLHFGDAKNFAVQYKKVFWHSPRDERKNIVLQQKERVAKRR